MATPSSAPGPTVRPDVEVRRSRRRRTTVAAYRKADKVIVMIPARLSRAEERDWVDTMLSRLERSERRRRPSDATLLRRARELNDRHLEGLAAPRAVRWVDNQSTRWGSCTPSDRTIRLSRRLQGMPSWVVDYVLVHELAHLLDSGHTEAFWAWVDRFPRAERARGFLEGATFASTSPDSEALGCTPSAPPTADPPRVSRAEEPCSANGPPPAPA